MTELLTKAKTYLRREENRYLRYTWFLIIYLIAFFVVERIVPVESCSPTDLPIDEHIPLLEEFVIPYVLWFPMLAGMGLLLIWKKERQAYQRYMVYIAVAFMSTLALYILFPNCQNLRPEVMPRENLCTWILTTFVYAGDNNANVCPSLHVIGSFAVCFAAMDAESLRKPWIQLLIWVFAFVVAISTIFVRQHGIIDLILAVPYSVAMYFIVYKLIYRR